VPGRGLLAQRPGRFSVDAENLRPEGVQKCTCCAYLVAENLMQFAAVGVSTAGGVGLGGVVQSRSLRRARFQACKRRHSVAREQIAAQARPPSPHDRTRGRAPRVVLAPMTERASFRLKTGLAEMLKGGVIMDVVDPEQAVVAEQAGACAVMALERVPSDIRRDGGVARMSDPAMIKGIQEAVTIPVMAKARIGHFAEAQVLQSLEVDYIDESEVLTPADESNHIDKYAFDVPFVCGATNLGEALRRLGEGAAMIRSKGEAGTGNIVEAVRHMREITSGIKRLAQLGPEELAGAAKEHQSPLEVVREVAAAGKLPVPLFCAGGIATPADAALMMQLGAEGNFVGSGIFKSSDPERRARAIVEATTHFNDPERVAAASIGLGEAMPGLEIADLAAADALLQGRGA